ncbi:MAG: oxidoreductase [Candidatus Heimdallarchaeota archaeon]|nr:oxidoreductase [Candidatus Heimdallarchaeota archaeon]
MDTDIQGDVFSLRDQIVVVTGGAGLLGKKMVEVFCKVGSHVIIADIDEIKGKNLVEKLIGEGFNNTYFEYLDIGSRVSIQTLISNILEKFGKIDVWINNAYPRTKEFGAKFEEISDESWNQNIDLHLGGYFKCSQEILKVMKKQLYGVIINLGSIYGVLGPNFSIYDGTSIINPAEYSAIKGGIVNFTRYLATYYGKYNIRVNSICPGGVFDNQDPIFVKNYEKLTPLGRMATPIDIANVALFLGSNLSSYITGQVIMVDGGWSSW